MTSANFRRTLVGAAVATALGVLGSPAGAAPYGGAFDPDSFGGEYIIDVNPSCLALNGWLANNDMCGPMSLTSAFADVVNSNPAYVGQLTFAPPTSDLLGIYVYGGEIVAFDTDLVQNSGSDPTSGDTWFIQFVSGMMPSCIENCYDFSDFAPANVIDPSLQGVYLYVNQGVDPVQRADYIGPAAAIPEPGTLSLLFGALGGGWLARRKRKEKVPDPN